MVSGQACLLTVVAYLETESFTHRCSPWNLLKMLCSTTYCRQSHARGKKCPQWANIIADEFCGSVSHICSVTLERVFLRAAAVRRYLGTSLPILFKPGLVSCCLVYGYRARVCERRRHVPSPATVVPRYTTEQLPTRGQQTNPREGCNVAHLHGCRFAQTWHPFGYHPNRGAPITVRALMQKPIRPGQGR